MIARFLFQLHDRGDGGLGVQRVEDRLHDEEIDIALGQRAGLRLVDVFQIVERDFAIFRLVHVRRQGQRLVGRPDGAGDETRLVRGFLGHLVGRFAIDLRGVQIDLVNVRFALIIGLADLGRAERVGQDDIGAGLHIGARDFLQRLRAGNRQDVVIALQVAGVIGELVVAEIVLGEAVILDHGAPGAIEDQDAFFRDFAEFFDAFLAVHSAASFMGRRWTCCFIPSTRQVA